MNPKTSALILGDLQNDFLHRDGAYGRAGQTHAAIAALPDQLAPLVQTARTRGVLILATLFTLVPGRGGEPMISPHLKALRPFSARATLRRAAGVSSWSMGWRRPTSPWKRSPIRRSTCRGSNGFCVNAASRSSTSRAS
jgi:nicotinamidase-related amidase